MTMKSLVHPAYGEMTRIGCATKWAPSQVLQRLDAVPGVEAGPVQAQEASSEVQEQHQEASLEAQQVHQTQEASLRDRKRFCRRHFRRRRHLWARVTFLTQETSQEAREASLEALEAFLQVPQVPHVVPGMGGALVWEKAHQAQ